MIKKTPLYDLHENCGGKMVEFAGFLMPLQYSGIIEEHLAVRRKAGLFDVSHMGEVMLEGSGATANLNYLMTNDFSKMNDGRVRYTLMCNENGGVVDDLLVYRFSEDRYMLVLNAANIEKDINWINTRLTGSANLTDISGTTAEIALQGPESENILRKLAAGEIPGKYYTFSASLDVAGTDCLVSRTGYTGEDGFELYCASRDAEKLWNAITDAGKNLGLIPAGLGARDTLRLEASMPLYGHEMNEDITPFEAGLGFAVKTDKDSFIGRSALSENNDPDKIRVGLEMVGRGIAREGYKVYMDGISAGHITSGTFLPFLEKACAMALVTRNAAAPGTLLTVDVRGKPVDGRVVKLPFYRRNIL